MTRPLLALGLLMLSLSGVAHGDTPSPMSGAIQVDGLSCPFCAYGLEKKLIAVPWVASVKIRVDAGRADFTVKPKMTPDISALEKAVEAGGFTPAGVTLTAHGTIERSGSDVTLVVASGPRIGIEPGPKRDALLGALGKKAGPVHVEGQAGTTGTRTHIALQSFRIL